MVARLASNLLDEKKFHQKFLPEYMALLKTRSKKRLSYEQSRDFYRLAAMLANVAQNEEDDDLLAGNTPEDLLMSSFLESNYQEKSAVFSRTLADGRAFHFEEALVPVVIDKLNRAMNFQDQSLWHRANKKNFDIFNFFDPPERPVLRNEISFSPEEISTLLMLMARPIVEALEEYESHIPHASSMRALDFHLCLSYFMEESSRPFLLFGDVYGREQRVLVEQARIFWSHRMRQKSLQRKSGADPRTRYFHATIRGDKESRIDVIYWLTIDDEQRLKDGGFIDHEASFLPKRLFCPWHIIETIGRKMPYPSMPNEHDRAPFAAVLQLYLDSLIS